MQSNTAPILERRLAYGALALAGVGLLVTGLRVDGWSFFAWQNAVLFKQITGYFLLASLVFLSGYGWLRRRRLHAAIEPRLASLHHWAGLLVAAVVLGHMGRQPVGILLALAVLLLTLVVTGAVRTHLGKRVGAPTSRALLVFHIVSASLVLALSLAHLYFVYSYTA